MKENFTALFVGDSVGREFRTAFLKQGGKDFSDLDWIKYISWGNGKIRFQCCMSSKDEGSSLYIRAIRGHTGGKLIALENLGHVTIPFNWKEFIFHEGSSFDCTSILKSELVAGKRTSKDGRQTVFFAPLSPMFENDPEEEWPKRRLHETEKRTSSK